jgi:hypothetical protein
VDVDLEMWLWIWRCGCGFGDVEMWIDVERTVQMWSGQDRCGVDRWGVERWGDDGEMERWKEEKRKKGRVHPSGSGEVRLKM